MMGAAAENPSSAGNVEDRRKRPDHGAGTKPTASTEAPITLTVRIKLSLCRRGGRKLVIGPDGEDFRHSAPRIDNAMVKALARAFRWRALLESGEHATIDEIAKSERINPSYIGRLLRLTLLAPSTIEAITQGSQPATLQLADLLAPFPSDWVAQADKFGF